MAIGCVTVATDAPGRLLTGIAAAGLLIFAAGSWRGRPRLAITPGGLVYRGWVRTHTLTRAEIDTIRITQFRRWGMVTAFGVFWMTQYFEESLPYELIEAARVDGCNMIRTFWHVALPAAKPAAAMLALFTFVASWTNFFWPFIVLGSTNPTLPVSLQPLQASYFKDYSLIMAGVVLATLPLIALFIVAGKQLVSGIMAGAVKG